MLQFFFSISLFLSAVLLFSIQPMAAKALLPVYGGTPAVWTVCMLFFQTMLLFSYGYAWLLSRWVHPWGWRISHGLSVLLSLISLPLVFAPSWMEGAPEFTILKYLVYQFGLPLLIVGASAPLLQFAYSQTKNKYASDPYFLYAASNIGSLLALISYPWLIERYIGLNKQFYYWNFLFIFYLVFLVIILFTVPYQPLLKPKLLKTNFIWSRVLQWISYSFIPCSLMLGVTFYISVDIAATPLFWVFPLACYLLSFIITFAKKPLLSHAWVERHILFFIIFPVLGFIFGANQLQGWQLIIFHLLSFFMLALLCHGHLVRIRPPASQLTAFYFCLALGGMLAGLFNSLLAPRFFANAYEYPLVFALAMFCVSLPKFTRIGPMPIVVLGLLLVNYFLPNQFWAIALKKYHVAEVLALSFIVIWPKNRITLFTGMSILFIFLFSPWFQQSQILSQQRNFYGIKQVFSLAGVHVLMSQNTVHGFQIPSQSKPISGTIAYYGPMLPVVQHLQKIHQPLRSTILGVGTGMMACQYHQDDQLTMIDIDEQVLSIATDNNLFTYLRDCPPHISLLKGDGRLVLRNNQLANSELLVIDAFSSDAIPTHLLTLEAFRLYQQRITPDGIILAHISNRHLRLLPVLTAAGRELQLLVLHKLDVGNNKSGQLPSEWVLLTENQPLAMELMREEGWRFVADAKSKLWTDDYSNLVPLLKW